MGARKLDRPVIFLKGQREPARLPMVIYSDRYQSLGLLVQIAEFLAVKDGSEYQQDDIFEWYKLSSMEGQDGGLVVCERILEASVLH